MITLREEDIRSRLAALPQTHQAAIAHRLSEHAKRYDIVNSVSDPAALARKCDPGYVITPAVQMISSAVEQVLHGRRRNLLITGPPQEFKSRLCAVWTPLRALQLEPNWRIMVLTYASELAREHSLTARDFVQQYGGGIQDPLTGEPLPNLLGLTLRQNVSAVGNWRINEGTGGILAVGRDGTITGKTAHLVIIDDPYKNMQEADSEAVRSSVDSWYRSVVKTRLAAGASIILIQTRWHPEDLAGTILKEQLSLPPELRTWRYLNIPALADHGIRDSLRREPGVYLESTRGRTREDWEDIRRTVGERVWAALYQGSPTPLEGGIFKQAWFDDHRLAAAPERTLYRIVAVDPAETGEHDEAGVVAAALLPDSRIAFTHDRSGKMTSDQWARAAVDLALETLSSEIHIEAYTAGDTYVSVVKREVRARLAGEDAYAGAPERSARKRQHLEYLLHRVKKWRGTGDAVARSALLRQAAEVGTAVMVADEMRKAEKQAREWQEGQHQPDRVAAMVIAHVNLAKKVSTAGQIASPLDAIRRHGGGGRALPTTTEAAGQRVPPGRRIA